MRNYIRYLRIVYGRACAETGQVLVGDRAAIVRTLVFVVAGGLVNALRSLDGTPITFVVNGLIGFVSGLVLWIISVLLWKIFATPADLYTNMKVQADKFTWNDVDIVMDQSTIPNAVCLMVSNNKPFDIHDANGTLTYLERGEKGILTDPQLQGRRILHWYKSPGYTSAAKKLSKKGDPSSSRPLVIATFNESTGAAWMPVTNKATGSEQPEEIPLEVNVRYRIGIDFAGNVGGRRMDTHTKHYWLVFDGKQVTMRDAK